MPSLRSFRCSGFLSFFWLSYLFGVVDLGFAVLEQHLAQVVCCFFWGVAQGGLCERAQLDAGFG